MKRRRNLPKLLEVYRIIENYAQTRHQPPTMGKLIDLGAGGSSSVISYYYDELVELNMGERIEGGKMHLLPLENANPAIRKLLK